MSRGKLKQAERLIKHGNIKEGRKILERMPNNATARQMLASLGDEPPQKSKPSRKRKFQQYTIGLLLLTCGLCYVAVSTTEDENGTATVETQPTRRPTQRATQESRLEPAQMTATADQPTGVLPSNRARTATSAAPLGEQAETRYISASVSTVNVRSCAGADCPRVDGLAFGTEIQLIGEDTASDGSTWYEFVYRGDSAWVHSDLTSETRPVAQPAAQPQQPSGGQEAPEPTAQPEQSQAQPTQRPTQPPAPPPVAAGCSCAGDTLNCSDFGPSSEAQACYNKCMAERGFDVHRLDGNDNDGLACESN